MLGGDIDRRSVEIHGGVQRHPDGLLRLFLADIYVDADALFGRVDVQRARAGKGEAHRLADGRALALDDLAAVVVRICRIDQSGEPVLALDLDGRVVLRVDRRAALVGKHDVLKHESYVRRLDLDPAVRISGLTVAGQGINAGLLDLEALLHLAQTVQDAHVRDRELVRIGLLLRGLDRHCHRALDLGDAVAVLQL